MAKPVPPLFKEGDEHITALIFGIIIGLLLAHFFFTSRTPKYRHDPRIAKICKF